MKIIEPSIEIINVPDYVEMLKKIERIGRVCYKSEDKIKENSAEGFIRGIIKRGHESVLEHASFCMELSPELYAGLQDQVKALEALAGYVSFLRFTDVTRPIVSGNVRAWRDFFKVSDEFSFSLELCRPLVELHPTLFEEWDAPGFGNSLEGHVKLLDPNTLTDLVERATHIDVSVSVICDRGVTHEIVRHRVASYSQESTRYCNYTDGKFGGQISFIDPCTGFGWDIETEKGENLWKVWNKAMDAAEWSYRQMLKYGATPQEARSVLPNSLKTEIVMTMNLREWRHFIKLRTSSAAHPQMREVAKMIGKELAKRYPVFFEDCV